MRILTICLSRLAAIFLIAGGHTLPVIAEEKILHFEANSAADYEGRGLSIYSNIVWSFWAPITERGFRLRAGSITSLYGMTPSSVFSAGFLPRDIDTITDLMLGYQLQAGTGWLKLYAGAGYDTDTRLIWEALDQTSNHAWGAKLAAESWWRLGERSWASADLSWLQIDNISSLYARAGYDLVRFEAGLNIAVGIEASASRNDAAHFNIGHRYYVENDYYRGGALLNVKYRAHDLTLSGGIAESSDNSETHPYAILSYGRKF